MKKEEKIKKLLISVDMINGFTKKGALADASINHIVNEISRLMKEKQEDEQIAFMEEAHEKEALEFNTFPKHCIEGEEESETIDELKEFKQNAMTFKKNSTCGFFAKGFKEYIDEQKDIKEITIVGCCTDICVMNLAIALKNYFNEIGRNIKIIVPQNAVETFNSPDHNKDIYNDMAFKLMKQAGIEIEYENKIETNNEISDERQKKLIDFYELTMTYAEHVNKVHEDKCYFDVFFRQNPGKAGYSLAGGINEIIDFVKNFKFDDDDIKYLESLGTFDKEYLDYLKDFKFKGDIYAIPEGTPIFPNEPCITVCGTALETQILETDILNRFNHGSVILTKAKRIVDAAQGRGVMEFGARRAQGPDAATLGAREAYIAGCIGTSCYETGKKYGIPLLGTQAHSFIMKFPTEYEAFKAYAKAFPDNTTLLVDSVDTLRSGVVNAIKLAREEGVKVKGIRIDSGDLVYLSKEARKLLDKADMQDTKICVSNSLDENIIEDLFRQGAPIDSFGVGENLITAKDCPVFGGVYKLAAVEEDGEIIPKIKLSNNVTKMTNPGYKKPYRFYDKKTGYAIGDVIALDGEEISKDRYTLIDEKDNWRQKTITNYEVRELMVPIFKNGELVYEIPTIEETRDYCKNQVETLYPEVRRLMNPHTYIVDLSEKLLETKKELIENLAEETRNLDNYLEGLTNEELDEVVDILDEVNREEDVLDNDGDKELIV